MDIDVETPWLNDFRSRSQHAVDELWAKYQAGDFHVAASTDHESRLEFIPQSDLLVIETRDERTSQIDGLQVQNFAAKDFIGNNFMGYTCRAHCLAFRGEKRHWSSFLDFAMNFAGDQRVEAGIKTASEVKFPEEGLVEGLTYDDFASRVEIMEHVIWLKRNQEPEALDGGQDTVTFLSVIKDGEQLVAPAPEDAQYDADVSFESEPNHQPPEAALPEEQVRTPEPPSDIPRIEVCPPTCDRPGTEYRRPVNYSPLTDPEEGDGVTNDKHLLVPENPNIDGTEALGAAINGQLPAADSGHDSAAQRMDQLDLDKAQEPHAAVDGGFDEDEIMPDGSLFGGSPEYLGQDDMDGQCNEATSNDPGTQPLHQSSENAVENTVETPPEESQDRLVASQEPKKSQQPLSEATATPQPFTQPNDDPVTNPNEDSAQRLIIPQEPQEPQGPLGPEEPLHESTSFQLLTETNPNPVDQDQQEPGDHPITSQEPEEPPFESIVTTQPPNQESQYPANQNQEESENHPAAAQESQKPSSVIATAFIEDRQQTAAATQSLSSQPLFGPHNDRIIDDGVGPKEPSEDGTDPLALSDGENKTPKHRQSSSQPSYEEDAALAARLAGEEVGIRYPMRKRSSTQERETPSPAKKRALQVTHRKKLPTSQPQGKENVPQTPQSKISTPKSSTTRKFKTFREGTRKNPQRSSAAKKAL